MPAPNDKGDVKFLPGVSKATPWEEPDAHTVKRAMSRAAYAGSRFPLIAPVDMLEPYPKGRDWPKNLCSSSTRIAPAFCADSSACPMRILHQVSAWFSPPTSKITGIDPSTEAFANVVLINYRYIH